MHLSSNSNWNEFCGCALLFKICPSIQYLNKLENSFFWTRKLWWTGNIVSLSNHTCTSKLPNWEKKMNSLCSSLAMFDCFLFTLYKAWN
jgi:hypothetical protein